MTCPSGYILVNGQCQWNYLQGDLNLDGTPDNNGTLPEIVVTAKAPDKDVAVQPQKSWLARNWYWIVLPTVVALVIWAWQRYQGSARVIKITNFISKKIKKR